jgi:FAD/FMN-containing dehydrogenase
MVDLSPFFIETEPSYGPKGAQISFQGGARIVDIESRAQYDLPDGKPQATPLASWPALGAGAILNTSGFGQLSRTYGLAIENLLDADVITTDGDIVRTSPEERSDLWKKLTHPPWKDPEESGLYCVSRMTLKLHPIAEVRSGHLAFSFSETQTVDVLKAWAAVFKPGAAKELNSSLRLYCRADSTPAAVLTFLIAPSDAMEEHSAKVDALIASLDTFTTRAAEPWVSEPGLRSVADHQQVTWRLPGVMPIGTRQDTDIIYVPLTADPEGFEAVWSSAARNLAAIPSPLKQMTTILISLVGSPVFHTPLFDTAAYEVIYSGRWVSNADDSTGSAWIAGCRDGTNKL